LGQNLTGPARVKQAGLTREFGPNSVWADREKRKKVLKYSVAEMNLNPKIFQIQTKFKPFSKTKMWDI
jgi:hypothetical protein